MFSLKKNKPHDNQRFLCIDVGTEFLKLLAFTVSDNKIKVEEYIKTRQHAAAMKNGTVTSIRRVIETVQDSFDSLKDKHFDGAVMGIAGELVKGVMVEAKYTRNKPQKPIDHNEINLVADKIR